MKIALALAACYFMGAIPFGLIIGLLVKGIDIRKFGSGNIGASNVLRTLGTGPALLVFFFDTIKGTAAVLLCANMGLGPYLVVAGALLSILGHTFSIFLKFKGGKGVATSLGVIIGLDWMVALIAFGLWAAIVLVTRYISLGSIIASASVPIMMIFWKAREVPQAYQILAAVAALTILIKHTSNIKRLLNGTENKIGCKVRVEEGGENESSK